MKKVLLVLALFASNVATADIQPEDIFGGILDIIQDKINKDKNPVYGPGVILKDIGNNRIALGRIRLKEENDTGSFTLPKCSTSPNQFVSALRFRVTGSDVAVKRIRIVYQNGDMENVSVNEEYANGSVSDWYQVDTGKRCVKSITVRGGPVNLTDDWDNDFGGHFDLGSINSFKKENWDGHPPITGWDPTELTFIGLKADENGF